MQCCPRFADWASELGDDVLHVYGAEIVPCSTYEVHLVQPGCINPQGQYSYSEDLTIHTTKFGDIADDPMELQPSYSDIASVVEKFLGDYPPGKVNAMLRHNIPPLSVLVNFEDISLVVDGFKQEAYIEAGPSLCDEACD